MKAAPGLSAAKSGLLAAFLTSGGFAVANLISSLVRNKGLALYLGPEGFGEWSQILAMALLIQIAASMGIGAGVTRYIAESRRNKQPPERVVGSALLLVGGTASLIALGVALLSPLVARLVLDRADWWWVVALAGLAAPLVALQQILHATLNGFQNYRGLAWAGMSNAFAAIGVALVAVWLLGAAGGAIFVVGSFGLNVLFHLNQARRHIRLAGLFTYDPAVVRGLLGYGGVAVVGAVLGALGSLAGRSLLLHEYGAAQNGYYQAVSGLTIQILPVFLSGITLYVAPRLGGVADRREISTIVGRVLRVVLLLVMPLLAAGAILREWFLRLLFSADFVAASPWLPVQFTGDLFLALAWATGSFLLPAGKLRPFLLLESARALIFLGAAVLLLRSGYFAQGLGALALAHLGAYAALCGFFAIFLRADIGPALREARFLGFTAALFWALALAASYLLPIPWRIVVYSLGLIIFWYANISKKEWRLLAEQLPFWRTAPTQTSGVPPN
jgi:O-antigen/teichoic acid export membrane protein